MGVSATPGPRWLKITLPPFLLQPKLFFLGQYCLFSSCSSRCCSSSRFLLLFVNTIFGADQVEMCKYQFCKIPPSSGSFWFIRSVLE